MTGKKMNGGMMLMNSFNIYYLNMIVLVNISLLLGWSVRSNNYY